MGLSTHSHSVEAGNWDPPPSQGPEEGAAILLSACPKLLELNMDLQVEPSLPRVLLPPFPSRLKPQVPSSLVLVCRGL